MARDSSESVTERQTLEDTEFLELLQGSAGSHLYIEYDDGDGIRALEGDIYFVTSEGAGDCRESKYLVRGTPEFSVTTYDSEYEHYAVVNPHDTSEEIVVDEFETMEVA